MSYKHIQDVNNLQRNHANQLFRKEPSEFVNEAINWHNEKLELIEKLRVEIELEEKDIQDNLCGHEELEMETPRGMSSYPDKDGHFASTHGDCKKCGKHFWHQFKVDDLYYETWMRD